MFLSTPATALGRLLLSPRVKAPRTHVLNVHKACRIRVIELDGQMVPPGNPPKVNSGEALPR